MTPEKARERAQALARMAAADTGEDEARGNEANSAGRQLAKLVLQYDLLAFAAPKSRDDDDDDDDDDDSDPMQDVVNEFFSSLRRNVAQSARERARAAQAKEPVYHYVLRIDGTRDYVVALSPTLKITAHASRARSFATIGEAKAYGERWGDGDDSFTVYRKRKE